MIIEKENNLIIRNNIINIIYNRYYNKFMRFKSVDLINEFKEENIKNDDDNNNIIMMCIIII